MKKSLLVCIAYLSLAIGANAALYQYTIEYDLEMYPDTKYPETFRDESGHLFRLGNLDKATIEFRIELETLVPGLTDAFPDHNNVSGRFLSFTAEGFDTRGKPYIINFLDSYLPQRSFSRMPYFEISGGSFVYELSGGLNESSHPTINQAWHMFSSFDPIGGTIGMFNDEPYTPEPNFAYTANRSRYTIENVSDSGVSLAVTALIIGMLAVGARRRVHAA